MDKYQSDSSSTPTGSSSAASIPIADVRYTLQEVRQHLKVTEQMTGFIEDQSDIENRFGLALQKSNGQPVSGRGDWLPVVSSSWECVIKATAAVGQQHVNRSLSVQGNVTKVFPELVKGSLKKMVGWVTRIQSQLEELHKARRQVKKTEDRYRKAFTEVDAAIRARDAAISAFTLTAGEAPSVAVSTSPSLSASATTSTGSLNINMNLNMKALTGGGGSSNSNGATGVGSGSAGVGVHANTAAATATPEAINRLHVRVKELFREFEAVEALMTTHVERYEKLRSEYEVEAARCNADLLSLERGVVSGGTGTGTGSVAVGAGAGAGAGGGRMEAVQQYLERYYMTSELFVSRCTDALALLSGDSGVPRGDGRFSVDSEVASFLATLKILEDDTASVCDGNDDGEGDNGDDGGGGGDGCDGGSDTRSVRSVRDSASVSANVSVSAFDDDDAFQRSPDASDSEDDDDEGRVPADTSALSHSLMLAVAEGLQQQVADDGTATVATATTTTAVSGDAESAAEPVLITAPSTHTNSSSSLSAALAAAANVASVSTIAVAEEPAGLHDIFDVSSAQTAAVVEYLDLLRCTMTRVQQQLTDIVEGERIFLRSSVKSFEKHGLLRELTHSQRGLSAAALNYFATTEPQLAAAISSASASAAASTVATGSTSAISGSFSTAANASASTACCNPCDSPSLQQCWSSVVRLYIGLVESHATTANLIMTKLLPPCEVALKRVETTRREALDKQKQYGSRLQTSRTAIRKATARLNKLQKELDERRGAIKGDVDGAARDSLTRESLTKDSGGVGGRASVGAMSAPALAPPLSKREVLSPSSGSTAAVAGAGADPMNTSIDSVDTLDTGSAAATGDCTNAATAVSAAAPVPAAPTGRRKSMLAGFDKFVRGTQKLGAAVGLATAETPEARVARIQLQIAGLEAEEVDCVRDVDVATAVLNDINTAFLSSLSAGIEGMKSSLLTDVAFLRSASLQLVDAFGTGLATTRRDSEAVHVSYKGINIEGDMIALVQKIRQLGSRSRSRSGSGGEVLSAGGATSATTGTGAGGVSGGEGATTAGEIPVEEDFSSSSAGGGGGSVDADTYAAILRSCSQSNDTMLSAIGLKKPGVGMAMTAGALSGQSAFISTCSMAEERAVLTALPEFKPFRTDLIEQEILNMNQSRGRGTSFAALSGSGSGGLSAVGGNGRGSGSTPVSPETKSRDNISSGSSAGASEAEAGAATIAAALAAAEAFDPTHSHGHVSSTSTYDGGEGLATLTASASTSALLNLNAATEDDPCDSAASASPTATATIGAATASRSTKMHRRRSRSFDYMQSVLKGDETNNDKNNSSNSQDTLHTAADKTTVAGATVGATTTTTTNNSRARKYSTDAADSLSLSSPSSSSFSSLLQSKTANSTSSMSFSSSAGNSGVLPELVKFGLSINDRIIESHSCAYYPKRGLMSQGRMYITQHFVAFSSWDGTRILLPLYYIKSLEKANSLFIIANALVITTCSLAHTRVPKSKTKKVETVIEGGGAEGEIGGSSTVGAGAGTGTGGDEASNAAAEGSAADAAAAEAAVDAAVDAAALAIKEGPEEEYNFGSFVDRDQCFSLLQRLQEIEKRLYSMNQEEMSELLVTSGLVFGNQKHTDKEKSTEKSTTVEKEEEEEGGGGISGGGGGEQSSGGSSDNTARTPVARRTSSMAMFTNIMKGKREEVAAVTTTATANAATTATAGATEAPASASSATSPTEESSSSLISVADDAAQAAKTAAADAALFTEACAASHLKVACFSGETIAMSVAEFQSHFVEDTAPYGLTKHHEVCGDNSMVLSSWTAETGSNTTTNNNTNSTGGNSPTQSSKFTRVMSFMKVCNLPGLKQTRGTKSQTWTRCGAAGLIIYTTTKLDDVPFADVFTVDDCFIVKAMGPHSVMIEASMEVKYVKSTMMKTFIDVSTNKEVVLWCKEYLAALRHNASTVLPAGVGAGGAAQIKAQAPQVPAGAGVAEVQTGAAGITTTVATAAGVPAAAPAPAPYFSESHFLIVASLLGLIALLLLLSMIQQHRSHYFILQHIEQLMEQTRSAESGGSAGGGGGGMHMQGSCEVLSQVQ